MFGNILFWPFARYFLGLCNFKMILSPLNSFILALMDKHYIYFAFFISGSDETPPACQSDESVAAALKDIKMAIQATRVLQHQTRIIPSNSNSNNSSMNPTAAAINSTVVSSTVNLTSIELVKYRVVKSQPSFPQILHTVKLQAGARVMTSSSHVSRLNFSKISKANNLVFSYPQKTTKIFTFFLP